MVAYGRKVLGSVIIIIVAGWNTYLNYIEIKDSLIAGSKSDITAVNHSLSTVTTDNATDLESYDGNNETVTKPGIPQLSTVTTIISDAADLDTVTKPSIPHASSPPEFQCPKSLFEAWKLMQEVDGFNFHHDGTDNSVEATPKIVLMRLPKESESFYTKRTRTSLVHFNYSFCESDSVDGHQLLGNTSSPSKTMEVFGLNHSYHSAGGIGCWMSHLTVWYLGLMYNTPIISLESDTKAAMKWTADKKLYKDYDILFLHSHPQLQRRCAPGQHVREGKNYWQATGAMLFTNNNPLKLKRVFQEELRDRQIVKPVGHWLNDMFTSKKLRIGSLCPNYFAQLQDHESTIIHRP